MPAGVPAVSPALTAIAKAAAIGWQVGVRCVTQLPGPSDSHKSTATIDLPGSCLFR